MLTLMFSTHALGNGIEIPGHRHPLFHARAHQRFRDAHHHLYHPPSPRHSYLATLPSFNYVQHQQIQHLVHRRPSSRDTNLQCGAVVVYEGKAT